MSDRLAHPTQITCSESEELRPGLQPLSGLTNYVGYGDNAEVLNPMLPAITKMLWGTKDERPVLLDERDADGCRHWKERDDA